MTVEIKDGMQFRGKLRIFLHLKAPLQTELGRRAGISPRTFKQEHELHMFPVCHQLGSEPATSGAGGGHHVKHRLVSELLTNQGDV